MSQELISIVVPLYNKDEQISRTINSVLKLNYKNWELIIIDDGSTDNSASIVKTYIYDERIKYVYKSNGGVSSARNLGVSKSRGEWIIFLDADDYFLPYALNVLISLTQEFNVKVATANFYKEKEGHKIAGCYGKKKKILRNNLKSCFFYEFSLRAGTTLFHKDILKGISFDESLSRYEDLKHIIEIMQNNNIAYDPKCIMIYSLDNSDLSHACKKVENDFIFNMQFENKCFWEKIILGRLLWEGINTYKSKTKELKIKYQKYLFYKDLSWWINLYVRMKFFMRKINIGIIQNSTLK